MSEYYHNLKYFTKTLTRKENDYYKTPCVASRIALTAFSNVVNCSSSGFNVLDAGCAEGVLSNAVYNIFPDVNIFGIDIVRMGYGYNFILGDFLKPPFNKTFDIIISNPLYKYAMDFLEQAFNLTKDNGYILFLLRLSFLESKIRYNTIWKNRKPIYIFPFSGRMSFVENGKTDTFTHGVFVWQKGNYPDFSKLKVLEYSYTMEENK